MSSPGRPRPPEPPSPSNPRRSHPIPPRDSKSSLYEAALAAVRDRAAQARARSGQPPWRKRRSPFARVLVGIGLAGLGLLVLQPSWLAGPRRTARESPGVAAASLRLVLLRERDLIAAYQEKTGRLPASLADAGSLASGIDYRRSGGGFILSGHAGDSLIVLRSSDSTAAFLGQSLARLKNRGREP